MIDPQVLAFFVLAVASIASASGVIIFRNAVHSALSLILTLLFRALLLATGCDVYCSCANSYLCWRNYGLIPICGYNAGFRSRRFGIARSYTLATRHCC